MRVLTLVRIACLALLPAVLLEGADKKAFVVGIGKYESFAKLTNPVNDAKLMAKTLASIGFQVHGGAPLIDASAEQLQQAFLKFATGLNSQTDVVIYFAGHGIQAGGENLLLPADFQMPEKASATQAIRNAKLQSLQLGRILATLEDAKVPLSVIFLDCCRDQGITGGSAGLVFDGGLAEPKASDHTGEVAICFAAKHGQMALDGEGANSPFAESLSKRLMVSGQGLRQTFDLVTQDVRAVTSGKQQPYVYGTLTSDVYLAGVPSGIEQIAPSPGARIGAPKTVSELVSELIETMPTQATIRKRLGDPGTSRQIKPADSGLKKPLIYESYVTDQYGIQFFYEQDEERQWAARAFVLHLHKGRSLPVHRGHVDNTLFILGKTVVKELWDEKPEVIHDTGSGRYPALVGQFYFGRKGNYMDYLIPAQVVDIDKNKIDLKGIINACAIGSFSDDKPFAEFVSGYVGAPIGWMEE